MAMKRKPPAAPTQRQAARAEKQKIGQNYSHLFPKIKQNSSLQGEDITQFEYLKATDTAGDEKFQPKGQLSYLRISSLLNSSCKLLHTQKEPVRTVTETTQPRFFFQTQGYYNQTENTETFICDWQGWRSPEGIFLKAKPQNCKVLEPSAKKGNYFPRFQYHWKMKAWLIYLQMLP